jgi:hypothetical protein
MSHLLRFRLWLAAVALAGACFACATTSGGRGHVLTSIDPASEQLPDTVLGFTYTFKTKDHFLADGECQATFSNWDRGTRFTVAFKPPSGKILLSVPPGSTILKDIYCYRRAHWELKDDPAWVMKIEPSKINIVGSVSFNEDDQGTLHWRWHSLKPWEEELFKSPLKGEEPSRVIKSYPAKLNTK